MSTSTNTDVSSMEQQGFETKWAGRYDEAAGKATAIWGDVSDDLIIQAKGNTRALFGLIQEKTGETMEAIAQKIDEYTD